MAKRSPILGYNHNVRYRGLVFHVQTEDSGLLSPHLFTHMFHGGVIISTRKLVYDSGAAEDAIKSLMQAQHKAVLKDLRKGNFDDKIDQYLVGAPGLLPRGAVDEGDRPSEPEATRPGSSRQQTDLDHLDLEPPAVRSAPARTKTAERASAPSAIRNNLPPPPHDDLNVPTLDERDGGIAAAISAANATMPTLMPPDMGATVPTAVLQELSPLEIELELDEPDDEPLRPHRDTDIAAHLSDGIPNNAPLAQTTKRAPGESVPPLPPPPHAHPRAQSAVGAATLPPKLPPSRLPSRPAITPPQVMSRPVPVEQRRTENTDAIEVFSPAPPSADAPPGLTPRDSPGQYAQHKRVSQRIPQFETKERSGGVPVPSGLGRPGTGRPSSISTSPSTGIPRPIGTAPSAPKPPSRESGAAPVVPQATREPSSGAQRSRTPTPSRLATPTTSSGRASTNNTPPSSGGVVMTRPAVIVGAPAKPAQPTRVRKAREDEGRGFGQGLISEKSLDEVILAYLSEDADEK